MSEGNRVRVSIIEESVWKEIPTTGNMYVLPHTGGNFSPSLESTESETVRDDRQLADIIKTYESGEGDISYEIALDQEALMLLFEGGCFSARTTDIGISANVNISVDATAKTFTDDAAAGAFANAQVGQYMRVSGMAQSNNNGIHRITAKNSDNEVVAGDSTLTDETAGASTTIQGRWLVAPGLAEKSYTIEIAFLDKNLFYVMPGSKVSTLDFSIGIGEIITGSANFMGHSFYERVSGAVSDQPGVTLVEAPDSDYIQGCSNITAILEDKVDPDLCILSIELSLDNGLEKRHCVGGGVYPKRIKKNTCRVTGSLNAEFDSDDLLARSRGTVFTGHRLSFIAFHGSDELDYLTDRAVLIALPKIKYTGPELDLAGLDGETEVSQSFTSVRDPVEKALHFSFFDPVS